MGSAHAATGVAIATSRLLMFVAVLVIALFAERLVAQPCIQGGFKGSIRENRQSDESLNGGFCNNNIDGSEACGGAVGKIHWELKLSGTDEIDLLCSSSNGKLCIMRNDCRGEVLGTVISKTRVRLRGTTPSRNLKLLVSDDEDLTLCTDGADITVTCAGSYGGKVVFDSPFEQAPEVEGWETSSCGGCNFFASNLTAGASAFTHLEGYEVSEAGTHRGRLQVPEGADFDLILWQRMGSDWFQVAESETDAGVEEVVFEGSAGIYRWEIRALSGSGFWELRTEFPEGEEMSREE